MNAFNEILDTVSPIFKDDRENSQDALASLLTEAIVEAASNAQQGSAAAKIKAA